jgi:hypothetical protein
MIYSTVHDWVIDPEGPTLSRAVQGFDSILSIV